MFQCSPKAVFCWLEVGFILVERIAYTKVDSSKVTDWTLVFTPGKSFFVMFLLCSGDRRGRVLAVEVGFLPVLDMTRQDGFRKERTLTALQIGRAHV